MISGGLSGSLSGDYRDAVLEFRATALAGGVAFAIIPFDLARGRYFALFLNGRWTGRNYFVPLVGNVSDFVVVDTTSSISFLILETGDAETFTDVLPDMLAAYIDALSASRLCIFWSAGTQTTDPTGDTSGQLSGLTVQGAKRGVNVQDVPQLPQRGRLYYTLKTVVLEGGGSFTDQVPALGTYTWTVTDSHVDYAVGQIVRAENPGDPTNFMLGAVTAWDGSNLTLDVTDFGGIDNDNWVFRVPHYLLQWFAGGQKVASVEIAFDAFTFDSENNASGLRIAGNFAYDHDVALGEGWVDVEWPAAYQIHVVPVIELAAVNHVAGYAIGATAIAVDGTFRQLVGGDTLTFASHATVYTAVSFVTGVLTIGALTHAVADDEVITITHTGIVLPRTPEALVIDNGQDTRDYQSDPLAAGAVLYLVGQVSDEGVAEAFPEVPADSPQTIVAPPAAPTITGVTIVGGDMIVHFINGEAGCTYKCYSSKVNSPVNFGQTSLPAVVTTGTDATSVNVGALPDTTPVDNTADYATLAAALQAAVDTLNAAFLAGEIGFSTALDTALAAFDAALAAYETALGMPMGSYRRDVANAGGILASALAVLATDTRTLPAGWTVFADRAVGDTALNLISGTGQDAAGMLVAFSIDPAKKYRVHGLGPFGNPPDTVDGYLSLDQPLEEIVPATDDAVFSVDGGLSGDDWRVAMDGLYSSLLALLGSMLNGDQNYFPMPDGSDPSVEAAFAGTSLYDVAQPFVKVPVIRFCVQAVKGGVEELNGQIFAVEFASGGAVVAPRPNVPQIQELTLAGLVLTARVAVIEDNAASAAVSVTIVADDASTATAALPDAESSYHEVELVMTVGAGWRTVRVKSTDTNGVESNLSRPYYINVTDAAPVGATGVSAQPRRERGPA